jgi:hypothetical protein
VVGTPLAAHPICDAVRRNPPVARFTIGWIHPASDADAWIIGALSDRVGSESFRVVQIPDGTTAPTH